MKSAAEWIAFIIVIIVLYVMDAKHLAASNYNLFIIILIFIISALVIFLKIYSRQSGQDDQHQ